ncbi:MAG: hypothetical protein KatS3mg119_2076 [Rhodothalassiaceae bacterium]|nr:MAG: hypothetical protein KatS3mg119_2076 [Rhodothalassiaceae bacterium]
MFRWGAGDAADIDRIAEMAERALAELPEPIRSAIDHVVFRVEDWPDGARLRRMGLTSPWDLLGLYEGVPRGRRSIHDNARLPDVIRLYRMPICAYAEHHDLPLEAVVRHVLIHEIGHHFGLSDEEMEAIENGP